MNSRPFFAFVVATLTLPLAYAQPGYDVPIPKSAAPDKSKATEKKPVIPAPKSKDPPKPPPGPSAAEIAAKAETARVQQALQETEAEKAKRDKLAADEIAELKRRLAQSEAQKVVVPPPPPPADTPFQTTEAYPGGPGVVSLPPDSFMMGSSDYDNEKDSKGGSHQVTITKKFAMGQTEVTVAQYMACVNDAQSCDSPVGSQGSGAFPVVGVSWLQAGQYAKWLTRKAGLTADSPNRFRLPTEAEWEYAASAGGRTKWSGTNNQADLAKYANNGNKPEAVKLRTANDFKLYDMSGNVWEWVEDWYKKNYDGVPTDGSAYDKPGSGARVVRGGSWSVTSVNLRSANRSNISPGFQSSIIGFRVARTEF